MSAVENKMNAQSATTEKKRIIVKKSKVVLDETEEEVKTTTDVLSVATEELVEDNIDESEDEEDDASTNPSLEDEEEEIEKMMRELAAKKAAIQQKKMYMAKGKVILADFKKKLEEDKELLDIQINELTSKVEKVEETLADIDDLDTEDADAIAEFLTKNMPKEETIDDLVEARRKLDCLIEKHHPKSEMRTQDATPPVYGPVKWTCSRCGEEVEGSQKHECITDRWT